VVETEAADGPWLVIGLGNPGPDYAGHRHNVGVVVLDVLADRVGGRLRAHPRGRAEVLEGRLGGPPGVRVVLARPRSYMNDSGGPVASLRDYYGIGPARLVVVHDEIDLPYGTLRVKLGGGDNGHNGLRSLRRALGTGDYHRVRFGVGRPPGRQDPAEFVLRDFTAAERKELPVLVDRTADAVESLLVEGLAATQAAYNG
jgi:PTH1 family peptidyl-tRNA hydrolase